MFLAGGEPPFSRYDFMTFHSEPPFQVLGVFRFVTEITLPPFTKINTELLDDALPAVLVLKSALLIGEKFMI